MRKWILLLFAPALAFAQPTIQYFPLKVGIKTTTVPSALTVSGGVLADTMRTPHFKFPHVDGTANQILKTNGSGTLSWSDIFLPALSSTYFWVGNGSSVATAVTMSGDATMANTGAVTVADDSHAHTTTTISGIDISGDTNLSATGGVSLTGDQLSHSTADGYVHNPSGGSSAQITQYASAGTTKWITASGDVTIADGGAFTLAANAADSTNLADGSVTSETIKDGQVKYIDLAQALKDSLSKRGLVLKDSVKIGSGSDVWFRSTYYVSGDSSVAFLFYNTALSRVDTVYLFQQAGAGGASTGDITGVTAGNGLSGGGASGAVTLDILLSARAGLEISTDSLKVKLDGTTLSQSSAGLKANVGTASGTIAAGDHTHSGYVSSSLTSAYILVGNGSNVATAVAMSGDATISNTGAVAVGDDSHAHTTTTVSGLDISSDTNLDATSGIVLTGDQLTHSTADGYKHIPSTGASANMLQYSAAGTAKWVAFSGDATVADGGAITVADDSHAHIYSDIDATTSANWAGRVSDETGGAGVWVFSTSPTFTTDISIGSAGVKFSDDGDGAITLLGKGNGSDEDLTINLDDASNTVGLSSSTGVTKIDLGTMALETGDGTNITGEAKHRSFTVFSPNSVFTADSCICIWQKVPATIVIDSVTVTTSSASYNVAGDLRMAAAFIGRSGGSVAGSLIEPIDTTSGVYYTGSINNATVAAGKCIYLKLDSAPSASMSQFYVSFRYRY